MGADQPGNRERTMSDGWVLVVRCERPRGLKPARNEKNNDLDAGLKASSTVQEASKR
jgi:hypothetical protein